MLDHAPLYAVLLQYYDVGRFGKMILLGTIRRVSHILLCEGGHLAALAFFCIYSNAVCPVKYACSCRPDQGADFSIRERHSADKVVSVWGNGHVVS
jgi:hypothetical protein